VAKASTGGQKNAAEAPSIILTRITCTTFEETRYRRAAIAISAPLAIRIGFLPNRSDILPAGMARSVAVPPQLVPIRPISIHEPPKLDAYSGTIGAAKPDANINVKTKATSASRLTCWRIVSDTYRWHRRYAIYL
jgi:hypothetical protein